MNMMLNRKRISAKLKLTTKITTNDINNYHKYKKKKKHFGITVTFKNKTQYLVYFTKHEMT